MNPSKPHPILAAFLDFYFISLVMMSLIVLINKITSNVYLSPYVFMGIFVVLLIVIAIYHSWLNKKIGFLSYGEAVAGKVVRKKMKEWGNPYKRSRLPLFVTIVLSLLLIGSTWNKAVFMIPEWTFLMGGLLKVAAVFLGIYLVGRGKIRGVFIAMIPFVLGIPFSWLFYSKSADGIYLALMALFAIISLGYLACYFCYRD